MKALHVVGARPNFMKLAPVHRALRRAGGCAQVVVHTGQHYDANMSDVFWQQLDIPAPDYNLEVGSGSHAQQTAQIMQRFEPVLLEVKPDVVLVYGDVNSTVAAALVAAKLGVAVGHVEAGLRSYDWTMPEEINRVVTDRLADLLFTPSSDGNENLAREGVPAERVHLVGNVMIDTLVRLLPAATRLWDGAQLQQWAGRPYVLATLHRPGNVDDAARLRVMLATLSEIAESIPVIFPVHPRTRQRIAEIGASVNGHRLELTDPLGYLEFLALQSRAAAVLTDSGGIQEETTYLGIPCLTLRHNTERPITVSAGTNTLVGDDMGRLKDEVTRVLRGQYKKPVGPPPLWDGKASDRIAEVLTQDGMNRRFPGTNV